jgi:methylenetetrahydrofolate--tRNA-(uracil-5-)-methyltransferase
MEEQILVIGAGLAGSEAAMAIARMGVPVRLVEMRPERMTPAHRTGKPAELVCSNSLGGKGETNAKGLLQAEMREVSSLILKAADGAAVAAGGALAVDREQFSGIVEEALSEEPLIEREIQECVEIPEEGPVVLATGPLTSEGLAQRIQDDLGEAFLAFYDAAAPVVLGESLDMSKVFAQGRYDQEPDYLNCPLGEEEYRCLFEAIAGARKHVPHDWEKLEFFEGCMPIEEIARRGFLTPAHGPMKPRGLVDPKKGRSPFAVVQLRREDREGRMWSLVGFQTGLKWPDQKEVIALIPGLEKAEIVRYGVMHRNTFLNAPSLLGPTLELRKREGLFVAGVLCGVEGYLESAATGWLAGINVALRVLGREPFLPPAESMLGGLVRYLASANPENFQPMNANWGLLPEANVRGPKRARRKKKFERGLNAFKDAVGILFPAEGPQVSSSG